MPKKKKKTLTRNIKGKNIEFKLPTDPEKLKKLQMEAKVLKGMVKPVVKLKKEDRVVRAKLHKKDKRTIVLVPTKPSPPKPVVKLKKAPPVKKKRKKRLTEDEIFEKEQREADEKLIRWLKEGKMVKIDSVYYRVYSKYDIKTNISEDNDYYGRPRTVKEDKPKGETKGTFFYGKFLPEAIGENIIKLQKLSHITIDGKKIMSEGLYMTVPTRSSGEYAKFKFRDKQAQYQHDDEVARNKRIDDKYAKDFKK